MPEELNGDRDFDRRRLRELGGEAARESSWDAERLDAILDFAGNMDAAAAEMWRLKAGEYAELVDVSDSGASHKFSTLHQSALRMSAYYEGLAQVTPSGGARGTVTRKITRE